MIDTTKGAKATKDSPKNVVLAAVLSAAVVYIFCLLTLDKSDQSEKILTMETRIKSLEAQLAEKNDDLRRAQFATLRQAGQYPTIASANTAIKASGAHGQEQVASNVTSDAAPINTYQIMRELGTQSVNDPRSFSEKVNDFLADNPSKAKIAIASKSVFDMAHDRENLSDYALQTIYNNQTDPDLKRVIAQVLSMRGNNSLIDNQISEAQLNLSSENPVDRQQALTSLAKTHYVNAANTIAPLLQDPDINVKLDALLAIRATGNQTHVHMVEKLLNDPDPAVSSLASDVVSNLRNLSEIARTTLSTADVAAELVPIETM